MNTAIIVQARMGSTRLPSKVLKLLVDKTVLGHVLERCKTIAGSIVCCATVEGSDNNPIVLEAERYGVSVFCGSEIDVLDRYYQAARALGADIVMRVTSDCPLIDPKLCIEVLQLRARENADYACNNMPPSWPHGLDCEAFTFSWLERAAKEATRPSEREHVTPYIRNHPEARRVNLNGPGGEMVNYRWTLDTGADLRFLQELFSHLPNGREGWSWQAVLSVLEKNPALVNINAGQDRYEGLNKSIAKDIAAGSSSRKHQSRK